MTCSVNELCQERVGKTYEVGDANMEWGYCCRTTVSYVQPDKLSQLWNNSPCHMLPSIASESTLTAASCSVKTYSHAEPAYFSNSTM